jgi:CubicO group peptidase (beta-lactamase class C family)
MKKIILLYLIFQTTFSYSQTETFYKIDSILEPFQKSDSPGFSIGIVQNGSLVYSRGLGLANLEYNIQNSDTSVFSIASIAKQFTASCIWSLIQENKLTIDDDIRKFIPEFPFYGDTIKIKHMLNHTSGIRNYHAILELAGFDYDKEFHDNKFILDLACRQKGLNNKPGEKVIYGNTAYTMLAIVIERISNKNLNEYAKENFFSPLGMDHTFFRVSANPIIKNKAVGYVQNQDKTFSYFPSNQITYGAGSMGSTIKDLAKWSHMLNGMNPEFTGLTKFLTTCQVLNSGDTAKYANGLMVENYKGLNMLHHSGYGLGGHSQIIAIPELQLSIIILTNVDYMNPSQLSFEILDQLISENNKAKKANKKQFKFSKNELRPFEGQYKELNSDMKMEILIENDTLKSKGSQSKKALPLVGYDKGKFHRLNNESVKYEFVRSKGKEISMIIYFGGTPFYFERAEFIDPEKINLNDFPGNYFSSELNVSYRIIQENGNLFLSYPNNNMIELTAGQKDEFGNGNRVLYSFKRNENNDVTTLFVAAEGTVKEIEFIKTDN